MPGQSYITVDGTLADSVFEYGAVLELYNEGLQYNEKLNDFIIQDPQLEDEDDVQFKSELYKEIASSYTYLAKIPEKEIEPVLNLVVYILIFNREEFDTNFTTLLQDLLKIELTVDSVSKDKKKVNRLISVISTLSNVFNLLDEDDYELKNHIIDAILKIVKILNNAEILLPIVESLLPSLTSPSSIPNFKAIYEIIAPIDEVKSLRVLEISLSINNELLSLFIEQSINSLYKIDLKPLLKFESQYQTLIQEYHTKSVADFKTDSKFSNLSLKSKLINLSKLAKASTSLSFSTLKSELQFSSDLELEKFLIDAIKYKVISGKISQKDEVFIVTTLEIVEFEDKDWEIIADSLKSWKSNLKDIKNLIESASKKNKAN